MVLKKLFKWTLLGCGITVVLGGLTLGWLALFTPPQYVPETRTISDEKSFNLDEKVGWYHFDDGNDRLLTYGANGGLTINRFDTLAQSDLLPVSNDIFTRAFSSGEVEVIFQRDADSMVTGMFWVVDSLGHQAEKLSTGAYKPQAVQYQNEEVLLSGTLFCPRISGRVPVVVMIHGSGYSDRDSFWYLYQADYLAKQGIAVLLPDKRGCGKSGGEWHTASMVDFAGDALAAVRLLKSTDFIDTMKIGLFGLSQGGMIAPLAASESDDIAFVIDVSGSVVTFDDQLSFEIRNDMKADGWPGFILSIVEPVFSRRVKATRPIWWKKNGAYDPFVYWKQVRVPSLIIYGKKDESDNVPVAKSIKRMSSYSKESSDSLINVKVYPNSGHAMGDPETGWIREEYLKNLSNWILNQTEK